MIKLTIAIGIAFALTIQTVLKFVDYVHNVIERITS